MGATVSLARLLGQRVTLKWDLDRRGAAASHTEEKSNLHTRLLSLV